MYCFRLVPFPSVYAELTENGTLFIYIYTHSVPFSVYIYISTYIHTYTVLKNGNFPLFAANGNGKRKFVFLGQQTFPYMYIYAENGTNRKRK